MILETKAITKRFGALTAVNGVSLGVAAGSLHSIIGPNGAGKTTLFNLLTGTFPPTSGNIFFNEKEITGTPANRIAHLGLARSYQRTTVFPAFSLFDNVWISSFSTSKRSGLAWRNSNAYPEVAERANQALRDVGLEENSKQLAREISHGEQRQLELAIALAANPRVLLLDEPAAGVPKDESAELFAAIAGLSQDLTVLFIEHDMEVVFRFASRILVMVGGRILVEGPPQEIARDARVREVYLGTAHAA